MTEVQTLEILPTRSFPDLDPGQLPDDGVVLVECAVVSPGWVGEIDQIGSVRIDTGRLQDFGEADQGLSSSRVVHKDYAIERLGREGRPEDAGCESVKLGLGRRFALVVGFTTVGDELRVAVVPRVKGVEEVAMSRLDPGCAERAIPTDLAVFPRNKTRSLRFDHRRICLLVLKMVLRSPSSKLSPGICSDNSAFDEKTLKVK
jgi:hypothetical protein